LSKIYGPANPDHPGAKEMPVPVIKWPFGSHTVPDTVITDWKGTNRHRSLEVTERTMSI
jgi:hypothetical protein